ncbi:MAG: hypothetical protein RI932_537 [Pseudomonadota bacterium]|jgi:hypothetical protein
MEPIILLCVNVIAIQFGALSSTPSTTEVIDLPQVLVEVSPVSEINQLHLVIVEASSSAIVMGR